MTTTAPVGTPRRKRGRPRDPDSTRRILDAAREVVAELGVHGASMSAIAERAGVGKPTVYLRWPNAAALIAAARSEVFPLDEEIDDAYEGVRHWAEILLGQPDGRFLFEDLVAGLRRERS